jgi:carbon storage regulator CsrA
MTETAKSGNLVLTRKSGERIRIGGIWVTIGGVGGDKCKVIINAPREIEVVREEKLPEAEHFPVLSPKVILFAKLIEATTAYEAAVEAEAEPPKKPSLDLFNPKVAMSTS